MERQAVSSSNLRSVGYESESQTLEIEFHDSGIYQYYGVPAQMYESLVSASSPGQFLHYNVKGVYRYAKIR